MGHDRSVSVVCNGELLGSLAAERIDRKKHSISSKIPFETIDALLSYLCIDIYTIKYVGITYAAVNIDNLSQLYTEQLQERYPNWNFKIIPVSHHLAHAASSYYTSDFDKALVFIADGGGDLVNGYEEAESLYIATRQNGLQLLEQRLQTNAIHTLSREQFHLYPYMNEIYRTEQISIAKKYEQITYILGFGWNQSGKTMGLASYGKELFPINVPKISSLQCELTAEFLRNLSIILKLRFNLAVIYCEKQGRYCKYFTNLYRNTSYGYYRLFATTVSNISYLFCRRTVFKLPT